MGVTLIGFFTFFFDNLLMYLLMCCLFIFETKQEAQVRLHNALLFVTLLVLVNVQKANKNIITITQQDSFNNSFLEGNSNRFFKLFFQQTLMHLQM